MPCGDYARTAFMNLGITAAAMKNVVSEKTDVTQTVAEIATGQADVGFVYITDAKAANGKVDGVKLPAQAKPEHEGLHRGGQVGTEPGRGKGVRASGALPAGQATLQAAGFGKP